jgi:hypothetical protein
VQLVEDVSLSRTLSLELAREKGGGVVEKSSFSNFVFCGARSSYILTVIGLGSLVISHY